MENKATGIGQTSWGPTGFAVFPDKKSAMQAVDNLIGRDMQVSLRFAGAENNKAQINRLVTAEAGLKSDPATLLR